MVDDLPSTPDLNLESDTIIDQSDAMKRLHRFVERLPAAAIHIDGDEIYLNKAAEDLFGYPRSAMPTLEAFFRTLHPNEADVLIKRYRRDRAAGRFRPYSGIFVRADGAERVLRTRGVTDDLGDTWLVYDVTEQTTLNRELEEARLAADASNRAKSEFIANMSHEIRTPLNGVLAMVQLLRRSHPRPDQQEKLSMISASSHDLLRVINDILDFSKIDAGKLDLECIEFDLENVLETALANFAVVAERNQIGLYLEIAPNARGRRLGDPARLRQIVNNFVSNALKFTKDGSVRIRIAGMGADGREGLTIAVTDTGLGIPPDKLKLLFQKFTQVDASTTRRFGGTGLGLAICRELALLMGGRVWAESELGVGSTFWAELALPFVGDVVPRETLFAVDTFDDGLDESGDAEDLPAIRILAAEDNPTNQLVLSTIMAAFGLELSLVNNGREALEAWSANAFDLILMDIQMPEMDGVTATRLIRAGEAQSGRRRTPIIALSANAFSHQVAAYRSAGMDSHVPKPIDMDLLKSEIELVLATAESAADPTSAVA